MQNGAGGRRSDELAGVPSAQQQCGGKPSVLGGKLSAPGGDYRRKENGMGKAVAYARDDQLPLGIDQQKQQLADGQRGNAGQDHGRGAEPLR